MLFILIDEMAHALSMVKFSLLISTIFEPYSPIAYNINALHADSIHKYISIVRGVSYY